MATLWQLDMPKASSVAGTSTDLRYDPSSGRRLPLCANISHLNFNQPPLTLRGFMKKALMLIYGY